MAESFATKYRSKSIDEYVGNDFLKTTFLKQFSREPFPQVIMLEGESGCGKTTLARLMSKHCVCENPQFVEKDGSTVRLPCNECDTCLRVDHFIETGEDDDLYNVTELDATQQKGVQAIDQFVEMAKQENLMGGLQVYIIDECHRISKQGQNSFLKFLEDTPADKIFIFCTTDIEDVLETLRNRCKLTLKVRKPTSNDVVQVLKNVAEKENIPFEVGALKLIAERSKYVYRSALNNFENVFRGFGDVTVDNTSKALDIQNLDLLFDFFRYIDTKNITMYAHTLHQIKVSTGFAPFVEAMRDFVKRGLYIKNGIQLEGITPKELKNFQELFGRYSLAEVYNLLHFMNDIGTGDVETKLFLLGYKGFNANTSEEKEQVSKITIKESEVREEHRQMERHQEVQRSEYRAKTESDAGELLQELSVDDAKSMFGL